MKVYLAARYDRRAEMAGYAAELTRHGHECMAQWVSKEYAGGTEFTTEDFDSCAARDLTDILHSNILVAFLETEQTYNSGGRHVELGYALGRGIPVIVVGPPENVFHHLWNVTRCSEWRDAMKVLDFTRMVCERVHPDDVSPSLLYEHKPDAMSQLEAWLREAPKTRAVSVDLMPYGFRCVLEQSDMGNSAWDGPHIADAITAALREWKEGKA